MYPKIYVDHFRDFERSDKVFVAMPFRDAFKSRWASTFVPAVQSVGLRPYRVDVEVVSDSILTDILQGIGEAKLVLADISADKADIPSASVMYELGLAHAIRLPEEVIVVRGDSKDAPFDLTHIRAHRFDPSNIDDSRDMIAKLLDDATKEVDLTRDLIVKKVLRALEPSMMDVMATERDKDPISAPRGQAGSYGSYEWSEVRAIFSKLVEVGIFEAVPDSALYGYYRWTSLGRVIVDRLEKSD